MGWLTNCFKTISKSVLVFMFYISIVDASMIYVPQERPTTEGRLPPTDQPDVTYFWRWNIFTDDPSLHSAQEGSQVTDLLWLEQAGEQRYDVQNAWNKFKGFTFFTDPPPKPDDPLDSEADEVKEEGEDDSFGLILAVSISVSVLLLGGLTALVCRTVKATKGRGKIHSTSSSPDPHGRLPIFLMAPPPTGPPPVEDTLDMRYYGKGKKPNLPMLPPPPMVDIGNPRFNPWLK